MLSFNIAQLEQADPPAASCLYGVRYTRVSAVSKVQSCSQQELFLLYYTPKMKRSLFPRSLNLLLKFYNADKQQRAFCKCTYWLISGDKCSIL